MRFFTRHLPHRSAFYIRKREMRSYFTVISTRRFSGRAMRAQNSAWFPGRRRWMHGRCIWIRIISFFPKIMSGKKTVSLLWQAVEKPWSLCIRQWKKALWISKSVEKEETLRCMSVFTKHRSRRQSLSAKSRIKRKQYTNWSLLIRAKKIITMRLLFWPGTETVWKCLMGKRKSTIISIPVRRPC